MVSNRSMTVCVCVIGFMVKNCRKYHEYRLIRMVIFFFLPFRADFSRRKKEYVVQRWLNTNKFILKSNIRKAPLRMMPEYS